MTTQKKAEVIITPAQENNQANEKQEVDMEDESFSSDGSEA